MAGRDGGAAGGWAVMLRKKQREKVKVKRIGAGTCLRWIPAFRGNDIAVPDRQPTLQIWERKDEKEY